MGTADRDLSPAEAEALLASRPPHPELRPDDGLPADTRLWAALQRVSGGTWGGCIYDVETIVKALELGWKALQQRAGESGEALGDQQGQRSAGAPA